MTRSNQNGWTELTRDNYERDFADRHLLDEALANQAETQPQAIALTDAVGGVSYTWQEFEQTTTAIAAKLIDLGFEKGDVFASYLPMQAEQALLAYSCLKIGALYLVLNPQTDLQMLADAVAELTVKACAIEGDLPSREPDFADNLKAACPALETLICFGTADPPAGCIAGESFIEDARIFAKAEYEKGMDSDVLNRFTMRGMEIDEDDPAVAQLVTRTEKKPTLHTLSHRSISYSNMLIGAIGLEDAACIIANLPAYDLGLLGQLASAVFWGKRTLLMRSFDAKQTLDAVAGNEGVALIGKPEQFQAIWALDTYADCDRATLTAAVCLGSEPATHFTDRLTYMAPAAGCRSDLPILS